MNYKIMSLNLRLRTEGDGKNFFDFRRDRIVDMINKETPDLIGFQEATEEMVAYLRISLPQYTILGHGRDASFLNEGVPIAYRSNAFELHRFEQNWLSLTSENPGSRLEGSDQSICPRVMVYAELISKACKKPIAFCNVHTDHRGKQARFAECAMVCSRLMQSRYPFVLTGDFNAYPNSPEIQLITETKNVLGTVDLTQEIKGTFHDFTGHHEERKIDYIFSNLPADPKDSYAVLDDGDDGVFYSDHFAVCSKVTFL